ncbi:uncharacterized protein SPSK_10146 [Sporothrix schenckii 1099-18]|uniref:Uncharacterized protein n=1 Tax=Sporothrix schenckii 1099-18 TaxID=1397361 RepID=A0A0F2M510_SPOSC|nr:uncharacterized protein SPSK_10146 [Sporothrix schenckii 1099-18]KJR84788.1 hypothetical protein SPSK_10146 [Sporothrix schenckii 1099-18]
MAWWLSVTVELWQQAEGEPVRLSGRARAFTVQSRQRGHKAGGGLTLKRDGTLGQDIRAKRPKKAGPGQVPGPVQELKVRFCKKRRGSLERR